MTFMMSSTRKVGLGAPDEGRQAGDVGSGGRRARGEEVGQEAVADVPLGRGAEDPDAGSGHVDLGAERREVGDRVVVVAGGHGQDVAVVGGRVKDDAGPVVAGRGDDDGSLVVGVLTGVLEERVVGVAAQAEVDDVGALVRRPDDAVDDPAVEAVAVLIGDLDRQDPAVPGDAGDADGVVRVRRGDAGDVGAVPVVVGRVVVIVGEVAAGGDHLAGEVGMGHIDARIEDGDDGLGVAPGHVPGGRGLDVGAGRHLRLDARADVEDAAAVAQAVLVGQEIGVVGDVGQAGPVVGPGRLDVAVAAEHGQGLGDGNAGRGVHAVDADPGDAVDGRKAVGPEEPVGIRGLNAGAEADEDAAGCVAGGAADGQGPFDAELPGLARDRPSGPLELSCQDGFVRAQMRRQGR